MQIQKTIKRTIRGNKLMTHDEIRKLPTEALRDSIKNDDPDVDLHDMIEYELYIREYS